jgi:hypothetical protein
MKNNKDCSLCGGRGWFYCKSLGDEIHIETCECQPKENWFEKLIYWLKGI